MKKIKLEALKKEIDAKDLVDYRYDGEISSPLLYEAGFHYNDGNKFFAATLLTSGILKKIGIRGAISVNGICTGSYDRKTGILVIRTAIRKGLAPEIATFARGHEEIHAESHISGRNSFIEEMLEEN